MSICLMVGVKWHFWGSAALVHADAATGVFIMFSLGPNVWHTSGESHSIRLEI